MKKDRLYFSSKIELRKSPIHGWGVFAKTFIPKGEILEEVPFLVIPMSPTEASSIFIHYRFNFPSGNGKWKKQVIPFGNACLYNHSDTPNSWWYSDEENELFIFQTTKDIEPDMELTTYYGGSNYWSDGRQDTKIK